MRLAAWLSFAVLIAGCGSAAPTATPAPTAAPTLPALSIEPTVSPVAASTASASPGGSSPVPVRVDATLLERLPGAVDGVDGQPDPETATEVAADPALQSQIVAIAIAVYVAPETSASTGDYAVATVVRLRPGVFSETYYRDWRDTFDAGVCEQAGGVSTRAETTIAERRVHIGTCAGGIRTYHAHLADDVLVSIQGTGERRLGERIVEGLTE